MGLKDLVRNTLNEKIEVPIEPLSFPQNIKKQEQDDDSDSGSSWTFIPNKFSLHCLKNQLLINIFELKTVEQILDLLILVESNPQLFGKLDDLIKVFDKLTKTLFNLSFYDFLSSVAGKEINWLGVQERTPEQQSTYR